MADRREDRNRAARDGHREIVVVKAAQIQVRTASTHDQHGVITDLRGENPGEGRHDGGRCAVALHQCLEQSHVEHEAIFIFHQMTAEVAEACRPGSGDDRQ